MFNRAGANERSLIPDLTVDSRRAVSEGARLTDNQPGEFELRILINIQTPLTRGHRKLRGQRILVARVFPTLSFFSSQPILRENLGYTASRSFRGNYVAPSFYRIRENVPRTTDVLPRIDDLEER